MGNKQPRLPVRLFYSYSHRDELHRDNMEQSLAMLKQNGLLIGWFDRMILPGQQISRKIKQKMGEADIIVFLLSQSFINSKECIKEWNYAGQLANGKLLFRIPVVLEECAWLDLLGEDDVKALPNDGQPVASFKRDAVAWQQVYEGIKSVVREIRSTFSPKTMYLEELVKTEFLSEHHIELQDIFVFPSLTCLSPRADGGEFAQGATSPEELVKRRYSLIHGADRCGKTALCKHLQLTLIDQSCPALLIDLSEVPLSPTEDFYREQYSRQFSGDYYDWKQQPNKTLILDNLSPDRKSIDFVEFARGFFENIIVTTSSDIYQAYYRGDERLAEFDVLEIGYLTQSQQENLIRKRLELSERKEALTDGFIDRVEDQVNSIIISSRVVPRYPFYVLSILQTFEAFMPNDMTITSYGHCYHALIVSSLIRAGIDKRDKDLNTCFNFAEYLAFGIYQHRRRSKGEQFDFNEFVEDYTDRFIISEQIINRLKHSEYGIITSEGSFRTPYIYYFFLGKYLSRGGNDNKSVIEEMCDASHIDSNYLTLLFAIHHTSDEHIIDEILLRTMCNLEVVPPAALTREETNKFASIVESLPRDILSKRSVEEERQLERDARVEVGSSQSEASGQAEEIEEEPVNVCYQVLKSNEIMGQILRNKHGSLEKRKVIEIIETIADSGLRLVNIFCLDEKEVADFARFITKKHPKFDIERVKREIRFFSFLWTLANIEHIVRAINVPEIRKEVAQLVDRQSSSSPVYDLIGYFNQLDGADELREKEVAELRGLLKKHDDSFFRRVLSLRTQHYMNTHRSKPRVNQTVCSLLDIKYRERYRRTLQ